MKTVIVSGYFNPVHIGHLAYFNAARQLGDRLWVIVNNDIQVELKGSVPFMTTRDRFEIVNALGVVDGCLTSVDEDRTVCKSLRRLFRLAEEDGPVVFANGGDQTAETIPETAICKELGIEMVFGVGGEKTASSSELIEAAR